MASNSGVRSSDVSQDQLFVGKKQEQFKISDEDLRMAQDADFMANVISQRKDDMSAIQSAMANINAMAKDLAIETKKQGEKLNTISDNLYEADNQVEQGLDQLVKARDNQRSGSKCQRCLVFLIIIGLVSMGLIIYFSFM